VNLTLIKAVIKARRHGLLRLVPATRATRLDCLRDACAECCRNLGSPVVTQAQADHIAEQFLDVKDGVMFVKSKNSVCCLLDEGLCTIYANRPRGCIEYPWYNIDGRLYYDSGCPGIKHDTDQRPDPKDIQPFESFFPGTPKPVLWLIRKICLRRRA